MTRQRFSATRDLTAASRTPGPGCAPLFLCGACNKRKGTTGRKLAKVLGLRTWCCAKCVKAKA